MPQENVSFQQLFDQALSLQQQKNNDEALKLYQQTLDKGQAELSAPQASVIYYNMSTLAYDKSDFLHSYVWSKKALALDPGNHAAQKSLELYSKKFEVPVVAHQISTSENVNKILDQVPIDLFFVFSLIVFTLTLRLFFKNLVKRRQNQIELNGLKNFDWKPLVSFILLAVVVFATWFRFKSERLTRALITEPKTAVQTAAGENKTVIFEAQPGTEVEVLQIVSDYAQIRYPGAFSGWVLKKNIEILSSRLESK